jgi:hypothetical protein
VSGPITAEMLRRDMFNEDQGGSEYEKGYRAGWNHRGRSLIAQAETGIGGEGRGGGQVLDLRFKTELVKGRG